MALGTAVGIRETAASSIRRYFDIAADRLSLHPEMRWLLSAPFREMTVEIPLRRDDDRLQLFRGYRVQHNGVRGPLMGPLRIQSGLKIDALRATAESMTWRCAVANVPFGGAAGGLACDPSQLNAREFERLVRRYATRIHHLLGIYQDICAPGPNADSDVVSWIGDEFCSLHKDAVTPAVGKVANAGGLKDWDRVVGDAIAALVLRLIDDCQMPVSGLRAAVRSLDRSGFSTAAALEQAGCVIVGLAEERGALSRNAGIDMSEVANQIGESGVISGSATVDDSAFNSIDCDVLIVGGPECILGPAAANNVRARLVVETSELVVTPEADRVLANRGILVVPDLIAATGPVLAANAEWSNNVQRASRDEEKIQHEMNAQLIRTYEQVLARSQRENVSLRLAAYASAIERVARSERLRVA